jgi:hypothetical protein
MGLVGWFKQKFNIGGVKIRILEVGAVTETAGCLEGKLVLESARDAFVTLTYKLIAEKTTGSGQDKKKSTTVIDGMKVIMPHILEPNKPETVEITFMYNMEPWLQQRGSGGVLGKLGALATGGGDAGYEDYFLEVEGAVAGSWVNATARTPVRLVLPA